MTDDTKPPAAAPPDQIDTLDGVELPPALAPFEGIGLSHKTVEGLELMLYEGLPFHHAAERAGVLKQNLKRAFNIPRVRAAYNQALKDMLEGSAIQAHMRVQNLAITTNSDHVALEANKWIAGVGGIAALKRVEGKFSHTHQFGGFEYDEPETVDVTPDDAGGDYTSPNVEGEE